MSATETLVVQLRGVFGDRLQALLAFDPVINPAGTRADAVHTLAVVDRVTLSDLTACASLSRGWKRLRLEMPLLIGADEFSRSLDVFPLEFSAIMATRRVIAGADPFASLAIPTEDLRRACEVQARSHLVHLREGYVEAGGRRPEVARLLAASAAPFWTLLTNVARLRHGDDRDASIEALITESGLPTNILSHMRSAATSRHRRHQTDANLYPDYLRAAERLADYVDRWKRA